MNKAEDDGPWETVHSSRQKPRQTNGSHTTHGEEKKSAANASRNWRERPGKDTKENKDDEETKKSISRSKKAASGPSTTTTEKEKEKEKPTSKPSVLSSSSKPAWGALPPAAPVKLGSQQPTRSVSANATTSKAGEASNKASRTAPSSPSISATTNPSTSVASPNTTAETASTATAATSVATKPDAEDDASWRSQSKQDSTESAQVKETPVVKVAAPPPSVNAWDLRKKNLSGYNPSLPPASRPLGGHNPLPGQAASGVAPSTSGSSAVVHSNSSPLPNGDAKSAEVPKSSKKKKKAAAETSIVADPSLWPDVAQAAEATKKEEEKKEALKAKKESEEGSVIDEAAAGSEFQQVCRRWRADPAEKQKWKAIPAAELQAAADQQAEAARQLAAAKKKSKLEAASANAAPSKGKPRNRSVDPSRAGMANGHGEDVRLPPLPHVPRGAPVKPVFGTVHAGSEAGSQFEGSMTARRTSGSTPMSRQTSNQSRTSATGPSTHLASPAKSDTHLDAIPNGSHSKAMSLTGSSPVPQGSFPAHGNGFPRGGRSGRSSFSGRGRPFRGGPGGIKGYTSPNAVVQGLPADSLYARGYGMGFNTFYPVGSGSPQMASMSQVAQYSQGAYDPSQMQYMQYSRSNAPPPPMPQTTVPGIDPQRFYVLGQVEYYFSMQNLAMDFFLRQQVSSRMPYQSELTLQMDSEGWIEISMIASFNRLKSLTPDVAMVKEVMHLSSLLEVREDKVRLAGLESKRWVLPDAKPSTFPPDPITDTSSMSASTPGQESHTQSLADQEISDLALGVSGLPGLGMEDLNGSAIPMPKYAPGDVENALMKSSIPTSASGSVLAGDEGEEKVTETPGQTSASGDVEVEKVELR